MKKRNKKEKSIEINLIDGVEGTCLAINGYRIAGPKPYGGGTIIKTWNAKLEDFLTAIPEIKNRKNS